MATETPAKLTEVCLGSLSSVLLNLDIEEVPALEPGCEPAPIVVCDGGRTPDVVDGFHRAAGMLRWCRDNDIDPGEVDVEAVWVYDQGLIDRACEPGPRQREALAEIYEAAGVDY